MKIVNIGASVTQADIMENKIDLPAGHYVVAEDNKELTSFNGSVYSKDMEILLLLSQMHYEGAPYCMPDTVQMVFSNVTSDLEFIHISPNLNTLAAVTPFSDRKKTLDLSHTKLTYFGTNINGDTFDYIKFPAGEIYTPLRRIYYVSDTEVIHDGKIIAVLDSKVQKRYVTAAAAAEFAPVNHFFDINKTEPLHFEKVVLSDAIAKFDTEAFSRTLIESIEVSPHNPIFFTNEGCLYARIKDEQILYYVPYKTTKLHILDGTTSIMPHAAHGCSFSEITFPKNDIIIAHHAFCECVFPEYIEVNAGEIRDYGFAECCGGIAKINNLKITSHLAFNNAYFESVNFKNASKKTRDLIDKFAGLSQIGAILFT